MRDPTGRGTVAWLALYASAMGYLEAAVVVYLRRIYYPDSPLSLFPLRAWAPADLLVEVGREAATLAMILAVAMLASRAAARRFAAFLFIFGVWDLCYYLALRMTLGWPTGWTDWDILFLIPWAWCAPWIAPALVALLFAGWGAPALLGVRDPAFSPVAALLLGAGALLALTSFLQPALPLVRAGPAAAPQFLPGKFLWEVYLPGLAAMAFGLACAVRRR